MEADERAIELDLKAMVVRVEKSTDRSAGFGCVFGLAAIVGGAVAFGWKGGLGGFVALIVGFGLASSYDEWVLRRAVRRFHANYPVGTPAHAVAMQVLSELESEKKALEKLRTAIREGPDGEVVRRRRAEPTVEQALAGKPPELLPVPPANPPARTAPPSSLIPLEPFEPEPTPEKRDERDPGARGRD